MKLVKLPTAIGDAFVDARAVTAVFDTSDRGSCQVILDSREQGIGVRMPAHQVIDLVLGIDEIDDGDEEG